MPAELEILGLTKIEEEQWAQSRDEVVDLSSFIEGAIMVTVFATDFVEDPGPPELTWKVTLQTAIENSPQRYVDLVQIAETTAPTELPAHWYWYLKGPGVSSDGACSPGTPGFARYLRVKVSLPAGVYLTLDVKGLLKP